MNITSLPQFEVVGHAYDNFFSDHRIRGILYLDIQTDGQHDTGFNISNK